MKILRRIKLFYIIYNLFNYKKLKYQRALYQQFGLKKWYFSPLSSQDFPKEDYGDSPWLDKEDSQVALPKNPNYQTLPLPIQTELLNWSRDGVLVLKNFYSDSEVERVNFLLAETIKKHTLPVKDKRKIMFAVRYSRELRDLVSSDRLTNILKLILGRSVELFQSVNFYHGSEDPAHSDFLHMSTYPYGNLIAVWIALEDITTDNGPIYYYPGSHKLPYVMNKDFDHGGNNFLLGNDPKKNYYEKIVKVIGENNLEKKEFIASKGDIIIWHANMLHGGKQILDTSKTRRSMVLHYYGADVLRYHEITQRPTLMTDNMVDRLSAY